MAITEYPKQIVRIEHDPAAGTAEGDILVCADGSRWRELQCVSFAYAATGRTLARKEGNQIIKDASK